LLAEAVAEENSGRAAKGARGGSGDPIAAKRRAQLDEYIEEVFRVTKKRIFRTAIWKAAPYLDANKFERGNATIRGAARSTTGISPAF
jgi:hypothetical protein